MVPVDVSISLLNVSSLPCARTLAPSLDSAWMSSAPAFRPSVICPNVFSGSVNTTAIGSI